MAAVPILAAAAAAVSQEAAIPAPAAVFGHAAGARFTHVAQVRAWFERAARAAPGRLRLRELGRSYGGRPLYLAILASKTNLARFDAEIAPGWRALAAGTTTPDKASDLPPIVWLSYGVHGNETSSTEVAPLVAHDLLVKPGLAHLLDRIVVVIDPCLNPDGRERYIHGFEERSGRRPDPDPAAAEHAEPWPGGRTNHYMQDLNRDWAFQTQRETRLRIAAWLEMPPQVHLDYHEMYPEDDYFFFPADVPINRHVSPRILAWHRLFGRDNARAFDERRWRYYSAEEFDLFYPGYGDSWPSLMGAVGMTFEVGGHGAGGLAYRRRNGRVWTLKDRIDRHYVTSIQALETTARGADRMRRDFYETHREAEARGRSLRQRYLCIASDARRASLQALARLLLAQGIDVRMTTRNGRLRRATAQAGAEVLPLPAHSLVVDLAQPRGGLAAALLEPDPEISHLYFYDVSAWSLPLAYGLEPVWARELHAATAAWSDFAARTVALPARTVALVVDAGSGNAPRFAVAAETAGIETRLGSRPFRIAGRDFPVGSLALLPAAGQVEALKKLLASAPPVDAVAVPTTRSERGPDLGSSSFESLVRVRGVLAFGQGTPPSTSGALWHLFEQDLGLALTRLPQARLRPQQLTRYNLLILPGGALPPGLVGDVGRASLRRWIEQGGVLLALGASAAGIYRELLHGSPAAKPAGKGPAKPAPEPWRPLDRKRRERRRRSSPGSIVEVRVDPSHVLSGGYGATLPVLVRGTGPGFAKGGPGDIVAYYGKVKRLSGYLPEEARRRLAGTGYLLHARIGRGSVVLFHQDPQFRLVWHGLTRMFLNAALLLPRRDVRSR